MKEVKYIPLDLVKADKNPNIIWKVKDVSQDKRGNVLYRVVAAEDNDAFIYLYEHQIAPIPLTQEILEKNGWKKSIGWSYVGSEKRGYQFSKELDDKWVELDRMTYGDLQICQCENLRDWSYINECNRYFRFDFTYVHELQHLLFGLGLSMNLKV